MRVCPRCTELYADDAVYCPMDGGTLARVTDPLVGATVAQRYRILSRLGGGGMSAVYLARHVMIDRLSAVKVLRPDLSASPSQRDRFLREARAVNRINHPSIVEITDFGEWEGLLYLVMDYVAGEPLSALLAIGPLPWQRAARVGVQVASALGRAHQMGVIHRDLKPANVLVTRRDGVEVALLTDFGIAKILDAPTLTLTSQLFGTPGYIAPEYIEGAAVDARADLYSLGVLLYESLTAKMPHDEGGTAPLMLRVMRDPPRPIETFGVAMPPRLAAIVMRLLSRNPVSRARDAFQIEAELGELLAQGGRSPAQSPPQGGSGPTHPGDDEPATSKPFAHLAPLCEAGLQRVEAAPRATADPALAYLLDRARDRVRELGAAARAVAGEQARIAALEQYARALRGGLGNAIDGLARELSRAQARLSETEQRRGELGREHGDRARAEHAALIDEEITTQALADEIAAETKALREHLRRRDESLDERIDAVRASLEGRVAALRSIGAETWRLVDEAGRRAGVKALPPDTMPRSAAPPPALARRLSAAATSKLLIDWPSPNASSLGPPVTRWREHDERCESPRQ
jgi:hypothetical protein